MTPRRTLLAAGCALLTLVAGCGGSSSNGGAGSATTRTAAPPATTTTGTTGTTTTDRGGADANRNRTVILGKRVPNPWKQPTHIPPHPHAHVDHVIVHDVKRGTGPVVRPRDWALLDFIAALYKPGYIYNRAWGDQKNYPTAGVILIPEPHFTRGLMIGLRGMRVGGRRQIIVPPSLSGTDTGHTDFRKILYWDVVLRGIYARGCTRVGLPCRSGPAS